MKPVLILRNTGSKKVIHLTLVMGPKRGRRNVRNEEGREVGEKVGKGRGGNRGLTFSNILPLAFFTGGKVNNI